jgi:hypothetical protein
MNGTVWPICLCSSPEAAHVLVGLLNQATELDVGTVDTDSIGRHTLAFGLGWLLGFTMRPASSGSRMPNSCARVVMDPIPRLTHGASGPRWSRMRPGIRSVIVDSVWLLRVRMPTTGSANPGCWSSSCW